MNKKNHVGTHHLVVPAHESREPLVRGSGWRGVPSFVITKQEASDVGPIETCLVQTIPGSRSRHGVAVTIIRAHGQLLLKPQARWMCNEMVKGFCPRIFLN